MSGDGGGRKEDEARGGGRTEGREWKETEGCRRGDKKGREEEECRNEGKKGGRGRWKMGGSREERREVEGGRRVFTIFIFNNFSI